MVVRASRVRCSSFIQRCSASRHRSILVCRKFCSAISSGSELCQTWVKHRLSIYSSASTRSSLPPEREEPVASATNAERRSLTVTPCCAAICRMPQYSDSGILKEMVFIQIEMPDGCAGILPASRIKIPRHPARRTPDKHRLHLRLLMSASDVGKLRFLLVLSSSGDNGESFSGPVPQPPGGLYRLGCLAQPAGVFGQSEQLAG